MARAVLAEPLAHCGEYHDPRNAFSGLAPLRGFAGTPESPGGMAFPSTGRTEIKRVA